MAIRIRRFSHQNMYVDTPFEMSIRIDGGAEDVSVEGLPDGFYYDFVASENRVYIRGTPGKLVFNENLFVYADDRVRRGTYSVNPLLPVFNTDIRETVTRGVPFSIPVQVQNAPVEVAIEGPWTGVRYRADNYGFNLYGTIPENANFTKSRFEYSVAVLNQSGTVNGTIVLEFGGAGGAMPKLYLLDGSTVRVFPSVGLSATGVQTLSQIKSFQLPAIPGVTANYVALANDGTNLYALHSKPQSDVSSASDLDDQVVVVSPETADGETAGLIRRFAIPRHSNYEDHELEDFFYHDGKLYILTSDVTTTLYNSYFVLYTIDGSDVQRILNLHARGGGIALAQNRLMAALFDRNSPNQGNRFRIYPPSWTSGRPLIADSHEVYTTPSPIAANFGITTNNVGMTAISNYVYILSSTLPNKLSTIEVPNPIGVVDRRNAINLDRTLSDPRGITHL